MEGRFFRRVAIPRCVGRPHACLCRPETRRAGPPVVNRRGLAQFFCGEIVPPVSYGIAAAVQSEAAILANALPGATRISVPGQMTGNWEFPTDVDYFRLDLPDTGILTTEKDLLGGFPDDPALVMAFGFPSGESSIWAEEDYEFLTTGDRRPACRLNPRILRRGSRRSCGEHDADVQFACVLVVVVVQCSTTCAGTICLPSGPCRVMDTVTPFMPSAVVMPCATTTECQPEALSTRNRLVLLAGPSVVVKPTTSSSESTTSRDLPSSTW